MGQLYFTMQLYIYPKDAGEMINSVDSDQTAPLTLLHSERPKLYAILAFLSAIGLSSLIWVCTVCSGEIYLSRYLHFYRHLCAHSAEKYLSEAVLMRVHR